MALLTLDELGGYQRTFGGDEGNSNPDYSTVPAEQQWLARYMGLAMLDPEKLRTMGNYYIGKPIETDEEFQRAHAIMTQNLFAAANAAGDPHGFADPTGIWRTPSRDKFIDYGGTLTKVGAGAVFGMGLGALGGAAAEGGATSAAAAPTATLPAAGTTIEGLSAFGGELGGGLSGGTVADTFFPDILGGATSDYLPPITGELGSTLPAVDTATGYLTPGLTEAGLASGFPEFETLSSAGLTGDNLSQLAKLLGNGQNSSIFGNRGILGTGLALAPALAAIQYARNQGPFDTSRLQSAYNQIDPNALALPFDLQTARGRENLSSSLTQRNVMGSSFGNQDLASYDLLRQAGRQNILTQGAQAQAGIGGQILDAQVKERLLKNDLYGRALLALSTGLNPPQTNTNVGGVPQTGSSTNDILKILGGAGSLYSMFA